MENSRKLNGFETAYANWVKDCVACFEEQERVIELSSKKEPNFLYDYYNHDKPASELIDWM